MSSPNSVPQFFKSLTSDHGTLENSSKHRPFRKQSIFITLVFISIFICFDLILPLYNKSLYAGFGAKGGFHYPVTTSLIQVGLTSCCLLFAVVANHIIKTQFLDLPNKHFIFKGGVKLFFLKV